MSPTKLANCFTGGYAQVHLDVQITGDRLQVPVNALLFPFRGPSRLS